MSLETQNNNRRLAKNTIVLYVRTAVLMLISLYTSRVILDILGVDDYGIYNAVGGAVAMFSVVSGSISNAISRFITFELGKGHQEKLKDVFVSSVNIQIAIAVIVLVLGETLGLWFLNYYMNIPEGRMFAANAVLHCSLVAFVINLMSVPYNACIIAHERMTAFAYIGILDAFLRLAIVLVLPLFTYDKLIVYSILVVLVALVIRIIYAVYSNHHFEESRYTFSFKIPLVKEMAGFSGWQFFANSCYIVNTQGVNILSNLFFGVAINAARGIATQVESAIMQFVNNFMTALTPQLVKSYAQGDQERFFSLICRGAKFSYYLLMLFAIPVLFEAEFLLSLWLKKVPVYSVLFVRLSVIASLANMLGNTSVAACMATGDLKRYTIIISSVGFSVFFLTWLAFYLGNGPEIAYYIFIVVYFAIIFVRLYVMIDLIKFPPMLYIRKVLLPIMPVTLFALLPPFIVTKTVSVEPIIRLVITTAICTISTATFIYVLGLTKNERQYIFSSVVNKLREI